MVEDTIETGMVWADVLHITSRMVSRSRPEEDTVGLDVNGSSLGNQGRVGIGGLIRSPDEVFITGFTGFAGVEANLMPELLALKKGPRLASNTGFRELPCNSDIQVDFHKYKTIIFWISDISWIVIGKLL
jgi:ribonuclease HI